MGPDERTVAAVPARMQQRIDALPPELAHRCLFAATHQRTTRAVGEAVAEAGFEDEQLQQARMAGDGTYRRRPAELEVLSAAKIAELLAPGRVLLRLAVAGFGVVLPPP